MKGECSYYTHYVEKNHGKKVAQMKLGIPRKILMFSNKQPAGKLPAGVLYKVILELEIFIWNQFGYLVFIIIL